MKKIKDGKAYDTEKAKLIGEWDNGRAGDRLYLCCEELYKKRTGEFFLHGFGGPGSKYGVSLGNGNWEGGEKIIPLTYEAAQKWAEEHLQGDEYEAIFGAIEEDDSRTTVTISLASGTVELAKRTAAQNGLSLSSYVEGLILASS